MKKKLQIDLEKINYKKSKDVKGLWMDFSITKPQEDLLKQRGKLYSLISLRGRWNLPGEQLIKSYFKNLEEYYYKSTETNVLKNLEKAVQFSHRQLTAQFQEGIEDGTFFNGLILVSWGNVIYVAQMGNAKALLVRREELEFIGANLEDNLKEELFGNAIHFASGLIKEEDILILGLSSFWKNFNPSKFKFWIQKKELTELKEKFLKHFEEEKCEQAIGLIFKFTVGIYPTEEEVIQISLPQEEGPSKIKGFSEKIISFWEEKKETLFAKREKHEPKNFFLNLINKDQKKEEILTEELEDLALEKKEEIVETKKISEKPEEMETKEKEEFPERPKRLRPQEPNFFSNLIESIREWGRRLIMKIAKKWKLLIDQIKEAKGRTKIEKNGKEEIEAKDPSFYLHRSGWKRLLSKKVLLIVLILIVVLTGSIVITNKMREKNKENRERQEKYEAMLTSLEEAKRVSYTEIDRKKVLFDAEQLLQELEAGNFETEKIEIFKAKQKELTEIIFNIVRFQETKLMADLNLKVEGALGDEIVILDNEIFILALNKKLLFILGMESGELKSTALPQEEVKHMAATEGGLYLYTINGIYKYEGGSFEKIIEKNEDFQDITGMASYYGNLYLLDKGEGQIWKYAGNGSSFSGAMSYLGREEEGFKTGQAIAIDGAIYILTTNGEIWKYAMGVKQDFVISGLDYDFNNPSAINAKEELSNIYILDQANKRMVALDKEGKYMKQYISEEWTNLKNLTVSLNQKAYLINGSEILEISL